MSKRTCPACLGELRLMATIQHTVSLEDNGPLFVDISRMTGVVEYQHTAWFDCSKCLRSYEAIVDERGNVRVGGVVRGEMRESKTHQLVLAADHIEG